MAPSRILGLSIETSPAVYDPSDDSLLLATSFDSRPGERCLDLCTGTGVAALVMARAGARVLATDVNPIACRLARSNALRNGLWVDVLQADLARGIDGTFDLVACNPPYLPTAPEDRVVGVLDRALSGGPDGAVVARRVVDDLPRLLSLRGRAFLVCTSLQPVSDLQKRAEARGLTWTVVARAPLGLEQLVCVGLARS